jgi:hypothetical protein
VIVRYCSSEWHNLKSIVVEPSTNVESCMIGKMRCWLWLDDLSTKFYLRYLFSKIFLRLENI